jgi:hypothetical protein
VIGFDIADDVLYSTVAGTAVAVVNTTANWVLWRLVTWRLAMVVGAFERAE